LTLSRLTYNVFIVVGCTFGVLTSKLSDYQTVQPKDSYRTQLPRLWNCNCGVCGFVSLVRTILVYLYSFIVFY